MVVSLAFVVVISVRRKNKTQKYVRDAVRPVKDQKDICGSGGGCRSCRIFPSAILGG